MQMPRLLAPVALSFATLVIITRSTSPAAGLPEALVASPDRVAALEVSRVRAHFDSVLFEVGARDVSALTNAQRASRAKVITALRAYRDRGVFPRNYDFPLRWTPYFVDRKTGTLCAVAHLLTLTGRDDIVRRVARANNNVYVAQLAGDTALLRWLDAHGLTIGEAARIQKVYGYEPSSPTVDAANKALTLTGAIALGTSVVASAWNAMGNSDGHRPLGSALGLASGIMSAGMGVAVLAQPAAPQGAKVAGGVVASVGVLGIALASHAMLHHSTVLKAERKAQAQHRALEASIAPLLAVRRAGVEVAIRF
jgi:hypothetical protein